MDNKKEKWILQTQECDEEYYFSGKMLITRGLSQQITEEEILLMLKEIHERVRKKKGADYLQVFKKGNQKIFCIDSLNRKMKESGEYDLEEHDHFTFMFSHEY
jgi:hypothetical protein